jgi:hypothetical protein
MVRVDAINVHASIHEDMGQHTDIRLELSSLATQSLMHAIWKE